MRVRTPQLRIRDLATRAKTAWLNCVLPIQRTVRVGPGWIGGSGHLSTPISVLPSPYSQLPFSLSTLVCKRGETYPDGYGRPSARPARQTGGTANQARDGRPPRPKRSRVAGRGCGRHSAGACRAARKSAAQPAGARCWIADRASGRDDAQLRRDPSHAFRRRRQRDRRAVANGNLNMPKAEREVNHRDTEAQRRPKRDDLASNVSQDSSSSAARHFSLFITPDSHLHSSLLLLLCASVSLWLTFRPEISAARGAEPDPDKALDGRDGRDLELDQFRPKSQLKTPEHLPPRAKFPVVDIHVHPKIRFRHSAEQLDDFVKLMDAQQIAICVSLDGGLGEAFDEHARYLWTKYPDRFA